MEQVEIDAEIEASVAETAVLQTFSDQDEIESYFEKQKTKATTVIPDAKITESMMENKKRAGHKIKDWKCSKCN